MDRDVMRERIAAEKNIKLYDLYMEEAAELILGHGKDVLKRARKRDKLPYVKFGGKGVRYFGYQIADMLIDQIRNEKWDGTDRRKNSRLETGISPDATVLTTGTDAGSMQKPEAQIVSRLASELTKT